ncbi:MAG: glycosyltransferase [Gammaproteobacteria bacterium]|nr:glycosyltransferase [Gammaproteobacteria bacterium]
MIWLAGASALCWLAVLLLPWQPWRLRERLTLAAPDPSTSLALADVRVLIPARNEAALLGGTLAAVLAQGPEIHVVVVDDESDDDTARIAAAAGERVTVVHGTPRPAGWTGKLWALQQAHAHARRPLTLLLDADIHLAPGTVAALREQLAQQGGGLVSVMASLRMTGFWERLLMPAFIYFFRLLYPFALVNRRHAKVAAAAGGCVLMPTALIDERDLFRRIRGELIDDCALAREVKAGGWPLWLGVSRAVTSARPAQDLETLAAMVRRTAFTQLGNSATVLTLCTVMMLLAFVVPMLALLAGGKVAALGLLAWIGMSLSYLPTLRFYGCAPLWALLLPVIGLLYLAFTWQSARSTWRGQRAQWRGRVYTSASATESATGSDS